jgi:hypothetical protein
MSNCLRGSKVMRQSCVDTLITEEPDDRIGHVRICGGDGQQWLSLPGNYYHCWRTHLSLGMDSPESRSVQPPELGKVVQFPEVGGLHHHYERVAA